VDLILQAVRWVLDGGNWVTTPRGPAIFSHLLSHLFLTAISVGLGAAIALPIGLLIGHTGKGRSGAVIVANASRALPTLGLLAILILLLGIGVLPPLIVLAILAIPPILAGAYAGLDSIDREPIDAARAIGMNEWQILFRVELPLAAPIIIGGLRAATLQVIATVAIASYFSLDSIGTYIMNGLASADYVQMIGGSILVTVLALVVDGILAVVQRFASPRGLAVRTASPRRTLRSFFPSKGIT
jgi:osmoprotectant transport system permease protein